MRNPTNPFLRCCWVLESCFDPCFDVFAIVAVVQLLPHHCSRGHPSSKQKGLRCVCSRRLTPLRFIGPYQATGDEGIQSACGLEELHCGLHILAKITEEAGSVPRECRFGRV